MDNQTVKTIKIKYALILIVHQNRSDEQYCYFMKNKIQSKKFDPFLYKITGKVQILNLYGEGTKIVIKINIYGCLKHGGRYATV